MSEEKDKSLEEQLKHCAGRDCKCSAYDYSECGCDVDWTPSEVYELRHKVKSLESRLKTSWNEAIDACVKAAEEFGEENNCCEPCEGHSDLYAGKGQGVAKQLKGLKR